MSDPAPAQMSRSISPRRRVLAENCYFDCSRQPIRCPTKFPQAVGPIYLAGAFALELCEVRCYEEVSSGPLTDPSLLGWADTLVLTGLTHCFDRMLYLTALRPDAEPKPIRCGRGTSSARAAAAVEKVF